jgi:hypothetical protein
MTASRRTSPPAEAALNAGMGVRVRREYRLRAALAVVIAVGFAALAVYGAYGVAGSGDIGVPFLVFGVAGALAQLVLAAALMSARAAITGDRYDRAAVTRARRSVSAVLVVLLAGVVVGFIAGTAALGGGLGGLMAFGLLAALAITADGWRHLRHLG